MAGEPDKAQLIAELAASRARLAEAGQALEAKGAELKRKLDLPSRAAASYRRHQAGWLAGAALLGFLLSRLPARKKVVYVERSTGDVLGAARAGGKWWGLVKFAAKLAKPVLTTVAGQRLGELAQRFSGQNFGDRQRESDAETAEE